jgi:hypothetical protein
MARGDIQLKAPSITIQNATIDDLRRGRDLIVQAQDNLVVENSSLTAGRNINLQGQSVRVQGNSNLQAQGDLTVQGNSNLQAQGDLTVQGNSNLQAQGDLTLQAQGTLTLADSQLYSLGNMQLLGQGAQESVQIFDSAANPNPLDSAANPNPLIVKTRGNLNIQGDQKVNIQALTRSESVFQSDGNLSLISNETITGNGRFSSGGDFSVLNLAGEPGKFSYTPSSSNGIISSNGNVNIGDTYTGVSLKVEARGSIVVEISHTGVRILLFPVQTQILQFWSSLPTLIYELANRTSPTIQHVTPDQSITEGGATLPLLLGHHQQAILK